MKNNLLKIFVETNTNKKLNLEVGIDTDIIGELKKKKAGLRNSTRVQ